MILQKLIARIEETTAPFVGYALETSQVKIDGDRLTIIYPNETKHIWDTLKSKQISAHIQDACRWTFQREMTVEIYGPVAIPHPPKLILPTSEPAPNRAPESFIKKQRAIITRDYESLFIRVGRRDGFFCQRCGDMRDLDIDHIRPVILFGKSELENLQMLCGSCNSSKGEKIIDYRRTIKVKILT